MLVVLATACSTSDPASSDATKASCDAYFAAESAFQRRCGSRSYGDERQSARLVRYRKQCQEGLAAPGVKTTPSFIDACAKSLATLPCNGNTSDGPCAAPAGSLADGAACHANEQCASDFCKRAISGDAGASALTACGQCASPLAFGTGCTYADKCVTGASCVNGVCVNLAVVAEGGSCKVSNTECDALLACNNAGVCARPGDAGAACSAGFECQGELGCVNKVCSPRPALGAKCTVDTRCDTDLACDPKTQKCVAVTYLEAGAACDGVAKQCDSGTCVIAPGGPGKCSDVLADGTACDPSNRSAICDEFAQCADGTCQIVDPKQCK